MQLRVRLFSMLTVTVLALAGCGGGDDDGVAATDPGPTGPATVDEPPASTEPEPDTEEVGEVPESLAFTATTVGGEPFDAAELAGEPVVLWFWADWCPRCHAQAPDMLSLSEDVAVIGVGGLAPADGMQGFIDRTSTEALTHLSDPDGEVWQKFGVQAQETLVLIDADGEIVLNGIVSVSEIRSELS